MELLSILTFGLKPIYDKHVAYYGIICDFRDKLPRHQNQAKKLTTDQIRERPYLGETAKHVNVVDTSTHKTNITEADIDLFYNKINNFDYRFMFFRSYYLESTKNFNRFNPKAQNGNFDLIVLQTVLKDDPRNPYKPFDVLIYHIKWKLKLTSPFFIWRTKKRFQNRRNKK